MDPEDLRGAVSLAELLTSLKRRRPPTEPLLRRKFDALSRSQSGITEEECCDERRL